MPLQQSSHHKNQFACPQLSKTINYCLESAAANMLHFQLCSAHYTASQTKNSVTIISAINPVTMENMDDSRLQMYCMHRGTANRHLGLVSKKKWDTKEDKGKSMMRALYVLRYSNRHILGRTDVEQ